MLVKYVKHPASYILLNKLCQKSFNNIYHLKCLKLDIERLYILKQYKLKIWNTRPSNSNSSYLL